MITHPILILIPYMMIVVNFEYAGVWTLHMAVVECATPPITDYRFLTNPLDPFTAGTVALSSSM